MLVFSNLSEKLYPLNRLKYLYSIIFYKFSRKSAKDAYKCLLNSLTAIRQCDFVNPWIQLLDSW
jgi:hypothetical protein